MFEAVQIKIQYKYIEIHNEMKDCIALTLQHVYGCLESYARLMLFAL